MRRPRRAAAALLALAAVLAAPPPAAAAQASIELSPAVRETLLGLQERWNRWLAALYQDDAPAAGQVVDELLAATGRLGMRTLPDLSRAAAVQAIEAARRGEEARAAIALAAAERLDPGRPETAFARARVEWRAGSPLAAAGAWLDGWLRLARQPLERRLWLAAAARLALTSLLLAGGLFVAALMAVRGPLLFAALRDRVARLLPGPAAVLAAAVLLVWPLALPGGPAWLVLYWSVLLWSGAARGQRVVLAALWLLVAASPLAVAAERERLAVELSPPARAVEDLLRGRLHGSLFADLAVLPALLPEEPAVSHLLADVHRRLGQWDRARDLYQQVIEAEPENAAALIDLGSYHYARGDFGGAVRLFGRAAEADPQSALAYFDLAQAHLKAYHYDEVEQAMGRAQALSDLEVSRWISQTTDERVPNADGGLGRAAEVRRRLAESWRLPAREGALARLREVRSLVLALVSAVAAVGFHLARRRGLGAGGGDERAPARWLVAGRWRRAALPGVPTLAAGGSFRALGALLVPAVLLLLPRADALGYEVPIGGWAGPVAAAVAAVGWLALAAVRVAAAGRGGTR